MSQTAPESIKTRQDVTTKVLYVVIGTLVMGIVVVGLFIVINQLPSPEQVNNTINIQDDFDGTTAIDPPKDMPDFTLTNQFGELTSLTDLRGKYVLLTFGYTHCPDVCPLTLNEFRRVQNSLGDLAEQVEFVFISVDGERDTPNILHQYFETRKLEGFIGLTGDEIDLRQLGIDYGLFFEKASGTSQGGYLVNHTAGSFLLNPDGQWIMRYQFGILPSVITADLETLLST